MRCKKHASDHTGAVGVCASCLRERLTAIIEAQTQLQIQAQLSRLHARNNGVAPEEQPHHPNPPPLIFPRSVSPYVSRRKSDDSAWPHHHSRSDHDHSHQRHHIRFYSTPQVGPTYDGAASMGGSCKKSRPRFSLLTSLFRSRSDNFWTDPRVSSRDSIPTSASAAASPSWLSSIFAGKRGKKSSKQCFADETSVVRVRSRHRRARGMSPDYTHDGGGGDDDDGDPSASGSGDSSTPDWKRTPIHATPSRRTRSGPVKNGSGLTFCLSPLVRASPNPHWNQKGMQGFPPELGISGEIRVATKPHLSSAASFSMNRSRKLADFGRGTSNR